MSHILEHRIANNYEEYLKITIETCLEETKETTFSSEKEVPLEIDEWIAFFGVRELQEGDYDEVEDWAEFLHNFKGNMELKPQEEEYPVLVSYHFAEQSARYNDVTSQLWDWISISKLGLAQNEKAKKTI